MPLKFLKIMLLTLMGTMVAVGNSSAADDVTVLLSAQPLNVAVGQQVNLTVVVSGAIRSVEQPVISGLENFTAAGTSQSSNFSIINGNINLSVSFEYALYAVNEGSFTLGPASVQVKGTRYSSGSVTVTVGPGGGAQQQPGSGSTAPPAPVAPSQPASSQVAPSAGASSPDGSVFIQGKVDRREVYMGEQVIYTFGFFYGTRMVENPEYTQPKFTGFWVEQIDQNAAQSTRTVNGRTYVVQELRYALFPTSAGEQTIPPANLAYVVTDIRSFFDNPRRYQLMTRPVTVKVIPLPEGGRPENFNGAVGSYAISAKIDKNEVRQGDPVTLEITLRGYGNIKTLQEPKLAGIKDFDIYESKSEENIERGPAGISGRKIFRYVLVPRQPGNYGWESIDYSYFDPGQKKYVVLGTEPVKFTVTPAMGGRDTPGYRLAPEKVLALGDDIRYIKEGREVLGFQETAPYGNPLFWAGHFVPLLSIGLAMAWRRHRGRLLSDTGYARLRGSGKRLSRNLKEASKAIAADRPAEAYAALDHALVGFIGDKLNTETRGMVTEQISELLSRRKGLDPALADEVIVCLENLAFARFAPSSATQEQAREYLVRIKKLALRLDREL